MLAAFVLSLLSGTFCAALICKAIRLKLWVDVVAALGGAAAGYASAKLAGAESWPFAGWPLGFLILVVALKLRKQQA
jgi:hypothetical protein